MWGFHWMFWLVPLLIFLMITRRHRRYWVVREWAGGPRYLDRAWGPPRRDWDRYQRDRRSPQQREEQQSHIEALESRITELEERLDFTEKLLEKRPEAPST
jgi:hypothetical protein